ncbi:MAG: M23 family metallopeptidase [Anaerolineae bacterium]|nr:M23 family metallopeptidase [Anaerolineae bacterium]
MSYRRRKSYGCFPWLGIATVIILVTVLWGGKIVRFITGADIMADLSADLKSAQPTAASSETPVRASTPIVMPTVGPEGVGDDGFPVAARPSVLKYTIQEGDSLFLIADRFNLNPNTIFWANTETLQDNVHLIYVGVQLYILPVNGVYHMANGKETIADIAAEYGVTPGDILNSDLNLLSQYDSSFVPPAQMHIVVPGGQRPYTSWQSPIRTGVTGGGSSPEALFHPGACREQYRGVGGGQAWINPLGAVPYRITNSFEPWHPGIDQASDRGTPIYASETGVVVFAGWHRDGYGDMVILDHGEGWTTYYGHLQTRFVSCGNQVSKGQIIGEMGMSGNSTGVHLHFELRLNDVPQNPRKYIEFRDMRDG